MTSPDLQRHGLESFVQNAPDDDASVNIQVQSGLVHVNLRGDSNDECFLTTTADVLGQALPTEPNTTTIDTHRAYWLGPDEWLILTESQSLIGELKVSLDGLSAAVNDISGGQLVFRLTGSHVRDVLARGCTIDLHPQVFTAGSCAQSGLAKANVMIGMPDLPDAFDVIVRRSYSDYLARWLRHTAAAYGVTFSET